MGGRRDVTPVGKREVTLTGEETCFGRFYNETHLSKGMQDIKGLENMEDNENITAGEKRKKKSKKEKHKKMRLSDGNESGELHDCSPELEGNEKQRRKHKKDKKPSKDSEELEEHVESTECDAELTKSSKKKKKHKKDKKSSEEVAELNEETLNVEHSEESISIPSSEQVESDMTVIKENKKETRQKGKDKVSKSENVFKDTSKVEGNDDNSEEEDPEKAAIRKKKREKRHQKKLDKLKEKQEREARAGTAKASAIEYLNQWDKNRAKWKFMKVRQTWCLQNMFDTDQVSDDTFEILLRYLKPLSGHAKTSTLTSAEKIIKEMEEDTGEDDTLACKADRARQIIQLLSDD